MAIVVPLAAVILIFVVILILCKRKPALFKCFSTQKADPVINIESTEKSADHIILFKNTNTLKVATAAAAKDEATLTREFTRLEAEVGQNITPNMKTAVGMAEGNKKHNRYKDIGKDIPYSIFIILALNIFQYLMMRTMWSWTTKQVV